MGAPVAPPDDDSDREILSSLPRRRPQRRTDKRASEGQGDEAAGPSGPGKAEAKPKPKPARKRAPAAGKKSAGARSGAKRPAAASASKAGTGSKRAGAGGKGRSPGTKAKAKPGPKARAGKAAGPTSKAVKSTPKATRPSHATARVRSADREGQPRTGGKTEPEAESRALVGSAVRTVGEVARVGLSVGEKLVKDLARRLRR